MASEERPSMTTRRLTGKPDTKDAKYEPTEHVSWLEDEDWLAQRPLVRRDLGFK